VTDPETIHQAKDAHAHIQKQFIAHKCKRLDASQNGKMAPSNTRRRG
jgi:hypothetical protein